MEMILLLVSWLAIILCSAFLRFFVGANIKRCKKSKRLSKLYLLYMRNKAGINFCAVR